ncbi:MAG: DNA-binding transcriptional ArsR family regulator/uncharacterized protein YndB with AHSA1 [Phycisphaerales bacterium]|jgi:DNA-binding transcriptional ArsR family regulator/uncharacterized protein YndB with AHSA1/START domain
MTRVTDDTQEMGQERVWKALSDPTRRGILDELRDGPRTTGDLASVFCGLSRYAVMKHIGVLEEAGLLLATKEGRQRWNHLNAVPLRQVYERWVGKFGDAWASSSVRLKEAAQRREQERLAEEQAKENDMATEISQAARVAVITTEIQIDARVSTVFDSWFADAADWFYESEDSRATKKTVMQRLVGGRAYIDLADSTGPGDQNTMAIVTMIKTNREVRLCGDFTCPHAFIANVTIKFEEVGDGTAVRITHRMAGEFPDDYPAGFEEGWLDGLTKLKRLLEA